MKDTTKLYLVTGIGYGLIFAQRIPTSTYIWGGILLGFILTLQKLFILQELQQKKLNNYNTMVEGMADYLDECKKQGEDDVLNNIQVFDGKEMKSMKEVIKEKEDAENEDKTTRSDSGEEDKT